MPFQGETNIRFLLKQFALKYAYFYTYSMQYINLTQKQWSRHVQNTKQNQHNLAIKL